MRGNKAPGYRITQKELDGISRFPLSRKHFDSLSRKKTGSSDGNDLNGEVPEDFAADGSGAKEEHSNHRRALFLTVAGVAQTGVRASRGAAGAVGDRTRITGRGLERPGSDPVNCPIGGASRARTDDLLVANEALSQAEL